MRQQDATAGLLPGPDRTQRNLGGVNITRTTLPTQAGFNCCQGVFAGVVMVKVDFGFQLRPFADFANTQQIEMTVLS